MDSGFYKLIVAQVVGTVAILLALFALAITIALKF